MAPLRNAALLVLALALVAGCADSNLAGLDEADIAAKGKQSKVDVCHVDGGTFQLLTINGNALAAHLKHGDGQPGSAYPGMPGKNFGPDCSPVQAYWWQQDFSVDATGWFGTVTASGGTANLAGSPFSRFDGYEATWPGDYFAEIDVYLDPAWTPGQGFDYSVASSNSGGGHLRDFIFHVSSIAGQGLYVFGSNNTNFAPRLDLHVQASYKVETAGWYTLQHAFRDAGGYLAVDLNLLDADGNVVWSRTLSNVADTIPGIVGGNRYAWFTFINVTGGITVDNHELYPGS